MNSIEFIIQNKTVSCSSCNEPFVTPVNFTLPEMTKTTPVEADLHRVLPHGAIRACMVAICPFCHYAWWTSTFTPHFFIPIGITEAPQIEYAKKFAHAVFTGRQKNFHPLERALLAMNGYWCAKESRQDTKKWLDLSTQELSTALADQNWQGNRARYQYLLAELLRLSSRFTEAVEYFTLVDESSKLPAELIANQKKLAQNKNNESNFLTNEQVETIFFPKLSIKNSAISGIKSKLNRELQKV